MTVAVLVICALSLVVQLAIGTSLFLAVRGLYKSMKAPLLPTPSAQPAKPAPQGPHIRLVGGEEK